MKKGSSVLSHAKSHVFLQNVVVNSDVRQALALIPDGSFHLTLTSPPYYNARCYSNYPSYRDYLDLLTQAFQLIYDKTKEGRFLVVNTSPVIIPRANRQNASKRMPIPFDTHNLLCSIGWEFIDDIIWVKPEGSVKNRVFEFSKHRKPLAYKPNCTTEYIMIYRKKTTKLIDWNIRQYSEETVEDSRVKDDFDRTNVWRMNTARCRVHPAVFPVELCRRIIAYYSYKGDLVFDPFAGIGTVGKTADKMGRFFFLTEQNPVYFNHMRTHIKPNIFSDSHFFSLKELEKAVSASVLVND